MRNLKPYMNGQTKQYSNKKKDKQRSSKSTQKTKYRARQSHKGNGNKLS